MKPPADMDGVRKESGTGLDPEDESALGFEHTLMYGRYSKDLGEFAKSESKRLRAIDKQRKDDDKERRKELHYYRGKWTRRVGKVFGFMWRNTFARLGEDWVFLCVLGVLMALVSFSVDYAISMCNRSRIWLYRDLTTHPVLQYISWVTLPVALILFSAGFVHIVSVSAVGSGIPEMKTILRGVPLDEYLTFRTLVAKVVGLTACLGSGMPLGKEGPFVHIASIVATLLTKLITSFKGIYENESRNSEMLAAACAVGVACSFGAPIGGVLFSIEVTSVYFAVRNYWRGFFAAVCAAMVFRLLSVWFMDEETITAVFKTDFKVDFPFDPQELFVFALIGVATGLLGALYVWIHRKYVKFMRQNMCMKSFLRQNRFLYPFFVALMISSITFPLGMGQFIAADLTTHDQVLDLFANFTWSSAELEIDQAEVVAHWTNPYTNFYINLIIYIGITMVTAVVASTMPVPSGTFIPVFKMGAAFGRLVGELMAMMFPTGFRYGSHVSTILPGGYAIVGAAALAGSVTNTISTSVIVFELTGQVTHILPVMIAVLIANAVSQLMQPSIYDSIIQIKKLPYLPDIVTSTHAYAVYVEDFMVREVKYIWHGITYRQLRDILRENKKLNSVPLVDSPESMVLLGSIRRKMLVVQLETHLGRDRRIEVVARWQRAAQRIQLAKHNHNWKALVALAKGEQVDAARQERRKSLTAELAGEPADDERERRQEEEDDVVGVSGARVARSVVDRSSPEPPPLERRPSRFAVTPVPSEDAGMGTMLGNSERPAELQVVAEVGAEASGEPPVKAPLALPESVETPQMTRPADKAAATPPRPEGDSAPRQRRGEKQDQHGVESVEHDPEDTEEGEPLIAAGDRPRFAVDTDDSEDERGATSSGARRWPLKPILKKTNSFSLKSASPQNTMTSTGNYATVTGGNDGRLRAAFERVMQKSRSLKRSSSNLKDDSNKSLSSQKHVTLPSIRDMDMSYEQQKRWEEQELDKEVDFNNCKIDPAPFQLVERTTLLKVHSLFSMLGLNHAYVTAIGRLIGVVALKELRQAIEKANHHQSPSGQSAEQPKPVESEHGKAATKV